METLFYMKSKRTSVEHCFKYDLNGDLKAFESVGAPLTQKGWLWLLRIDVFPFTVERMEKLAKDTELKKIIDIRKVPASVTFEDFWEAYGKIGTKAVAKKKFDKLKPEEVIKAFIGIEKEKSKKKLDGTAMPYAETYLNQKRWEVWATRTTSNKKTSQLALLYLLIGSFH